MSGKAYLIGAGPGRPDLITVRGLNLLRQADVVLYDWLVAPQLVDQARPNAVRIFVGKAHDRHTLEQDTITDLLVEYVRAGHHVARLKGGDPSVFGHVGEEAQALASAGLAFEIVPGVSSALAAPAYAGIPVTSRGYSTAFAVVTGHEAPGKADSTTDWNALAHIPTLIVLMGLHRVDLVCTTLIAAGRAASTPAAVISRATTREQRVVRATLADLPAALREANLPTPAILVIGEVVGLGATLEWFVPSLVEEGFEAFERLEQRTI
ncbi:uroporphyrin-III C-methyltransferase [Oscillochloris trichoides DG-6]|uniref:uroporphyrinogen-III C-methyltransferase n=1 Tax=Oscillochloris trichoides DG-6 TaxID=765420 RepID=E1IGF1_9CHLR|nr:uroporphyrinogen-III C-methyltransferase [Oscillochloris trichoides]EFO79717.1 uroporphyrin-III C-methyltransferase [Oscillochloris trichoides DG-6]